MLAIQRTSDNYNQWRTKILYDYATTVVCKVKQTRTIENLRLFNVK